ncbi:MAG: hypothetical protein ACRCYY_18075 [Trueperaceae bacterium]
MEISEVLIPVLTLVASVLGTFLAPWANWRFEEKKLLRTNREQLVAECREALLAEEDSSANFRNLPIYSRVEPFLSEKLIGDIARNVCTIRGGDLKSSKEIPRLSVGEYRQDLLGELAKLEKRWKLV